MKFRIAFESKKTMKNNFLSLIIKKIDDYKCLICFSLTKRIAKKKKIFNDFDFFFFFEIEASIFVMFFFLTIITNDFR